MGEGLSIKCRSGGWILGAEEARLKCRRGHKGSNECKDDDRLCVSVMVNLFGLEKK